MSMCISKHVARNLFMEQAGDPGATEALPPLHLQRGLVSPPWGQHPQDRTPCGELHEDSSS